MDMLATTGSPGTVSTAQERPDANTPSPAAPQRARVILYSASGNGPTELLARARSAGSPFQIASDHHQLSAALSSGNIDVVLVDENATPGAPHLFIRSIRDRSDAGIILLYANHDTSSVVLALEFGADDCFAQDLAASEALARIRALQSRLSRRGQSGSPGFEFEGWRLDKLTRTLLNPAGSTVRLTVREYEALVLLLENANRPVTREQLLETDALGATRAADALVGRLKRKLTRAGARPDLIRPIRSVGYQLAANTRTLG